MVLPVLTLSVAPTTVIRLMRISTIEVYDQNYGQQRPRAAYRALATILRRRVACAAAGHSRLGLQFSTM